MKSLTTKPGTFSAFCKLSSLKPWNDTTEGERETAESAGIRSYWHRGRGCEVLPIQCDETFTDAAALERHMQEVHPDRSPWTSNSLDARSYGNEVRKYPGLPLSIPVKLWKTPRLLADGKDLPKAAAGHLRVCPTCDLHGQVDTNAGELWWDEHVRGCALAAAS
jgi:hypothetical protein